MHDINKFMEKRSHTKVRKFCAIFFLFDGDSSKMAHKPPLYSEKKYINNGVGLVLCFTLSQIWLDYIR